MAGLRRLVVLSAIAVIAGCQTVPAPSWGVPDGIATAPVNGYPMAYQSQGTGPTVVLVHGVMCDYRCYDGLVKELAKDYRVLAVSMRHFYPEKWDGRGDDFSAAQHARDLTSFIEYVGAPVYLVAHSYGAQVAYEAARTKPALIRKLVLVEAPTESLVAPIDLAADRIRLRRAEETASTFSTGNLDSALQSVVDGINGQGVWQRYPPVARTIAKDNAWTIVGVMRQPTGDVRCTDFGALKMPVLIVSGAGTTERFRKNVQEQAKCLPTAQTATIPRAGHGSPYENPRDFAAAVTPFLHQ